MIMNQRVILLPVFCFFIIFAATSSSETQEKYRTSWGKRATPRNPHSPKIYEINLDLPYEDRWREVIQDHKQAFDELLSRLWIKSLPMGLADFIIYPLAYRYNPDFTEEIKAMANLGGISFTKVFLLNFLFDFAAACSSVLVQDPDGNVIHARTMDFDITNYVANLAFHGRYYKNGKLIYEALDFAGYAGILTAYKPDAYSFSINQYLVDNWSIKHGKLVLSYLRNLFNGKVTPPYVVRKAFEEAEDYESFIKILCETDTISRAYYIVAGPEKGQGAVITKFEDEVRNITRLDADNGRWYIAQTNYERDVEDPEEDNRKTAEDDRLEAIGKESVTMEKIFNEVMDMYPTFNAETIHTTIMKPSQNYFNTTLWF